MPRGWGRKYEYEAPPRKAMSAYSFYVQDWYRYHRRVLRTRNPHIVIREVAQNWKILEEEERKVYMQLAKDDKERAKREKAVYNDMICAGLIPSPPVRPRKTKQPGFPRLTLNSFVYFSNETRARVREENPNMPYVEVMRELARRWKGLMDHEKKQYRRLSKTDAARYKAAKRQFYRRRREAAALKRREDGRARLNWMFNRRVPTSKPQPEPPIEQEAGGGGA